MKTPWWKREVPWNVRTAIFCFLEGSTLSLITGIFLAPRRGFSVPKALSDAVVMIAFASLFALPVWSLAGHWKQGAFRRAGLITFAMVLLVGVLFPALQ